jgi:hypothetical protein
LDNNFQELEDILYGYGVSLRDDNENYRPFFDVLCDISNKWEDIGEDDQDKILTPFKK